MVVTNLVIVLQTELIGSGWTENPKTVPRGLCKEAEKPNIFMQKIRLNRKLLCCSYFIVVSVKVCVVLCTGS